MNAASKPITIDQVRAVVKGLGARASAYNCGAAAFKLGADLAINPYRGGTRGYHSFIRGYLAAERRAQGGAP